MKEILKVKYKHPFKIPTGREALIPVGYLQRVAEDLIKDLPRTNPYSGQRGDFNLGPLHCKSAPLTTRPRRMERYTIKTNLDGFPGGLS